MIPTEEQMKSISEMLLARIEAHGQAKLLINRCGASATTDYEGALLFYKYIPNVIELLLNQ